MNSGFIKSWAMCKVAGCEDDFAWLVSQSSRWFSFKEVQFK